jgi:hypothetical protein
VRASGGRVQGTHGTVLAKSSGCGAPARGYGQVSWARDGQTDASASRGDRARSRPLAPGGPGPDIVRDSVVDHRSRGGKSAEKQHETRTRTQTANITPEANGSTSSYGTCHHRFVRVQTRGAGTDRAFFVDAPAGCGGERWVSTDSRPRQGPRDGQLGQTPPRDTDSPGRPGSHRAPVSPSFRTGCVSPRTLQYVHSPLSSLPESLRRERALSTALSKARSVSLSPSTLTPLQLLLSLSLSLS